jgi:hypothetical protein
MAVRYERCTFERVQMKQPTEVSQSPRDGMYSAQKRKELLESPTISGLRKVWRAEAGC